MEDTPWRSEFPLDVPGVRRLLYAQCPEFQIDTVDYLHEGWDSWAFVINNEWVFRFPKRHEVDAWLQAELRVLELLCRKDLGVRIPAPMFLGKPDGVYPCHFAGYRMIHGTPGSQLEKHLIDKAQVARQLGQFLGELHQIEPKELSTIGVRIYDNALAQLAEEARSFSDDILLSLPRKLIPLVAAVFDERSFSPDMTAKNSLIHSDLGAEHILVSQTGDIAGIIDWGDVCVGNREVDFFGIGAWLGEEFVRRVLEHYPLAWDSAFLHRVGIGARYLALINLGWSLKGWGASADNHIRIVETAFGVQ